MKKKKQDHPKGEEQSDFWITVLVRENDIEKWAEQNGQQIQKECGHSIMECIKAVKCLANIEHGKDPFCNKVILFLISELDRLYNEKDRLLLSNAALMQPKEEYLDKDKRINELEYELDCQWYEAYGEGYELNCVGRLEIQKERDKLRDRVKQLEDSSQKHVLLRAKIRSILNVYKKGHNIGALLDNLANSVKEE
jgi:hypothetical protein